MDKKHSPNDKVNVLGELPDWFSGHHLEYPRFSDKDIENLLEDWRTISEQTLNNLLTRPGNDQSSLEIMAIAEGMDGYSQIRPNVRILDKKGLWHYTEIMLPVCVSSFFQILINKDHRFKILSDRVNQSLTDKEYLREVFYRLDPSVYAVDNFKEKEYVAIYLSPAAFSPLGDFISDLPTLIVTVGLSVLITSLFPPAGGITPLYFGIHFTSDVLPVVINKFFVPYIKKGMIWQDLNLNEKIVYSITLYQCEQTAKNQAVDMQGVRVSKADIVKILDYLITHDTERRKMLVDLSDWTWGQGFIQAVGTDGELTWMPKSKFARKLPDKQEIYQLVLVLPVYFNDKETKIISDDDIIDILSATKKKIKGSLNKMISTGLIVENNSQYGVIERLI